MKRQVSRHLNKTQRKVLVMGIALAVLVGVVLGMQLV